MEENKTSYTVALAELETILAELGRENADIDALAQKVARAGELIAYCRELLRKAETDVAKALGASDI